MPFSSTTLRVPALGGQEALGRATQPTHRSSHRPSNESSVAPEANLEPSPPTAATGRNASRMPCTSWVCATWWFPARAGPGAARHADERRPAFRRTVQWRTGSEGRISALKRSYGWDRGRIDTTEGARIWTGHGVLAHNLVKISALAA
jgi:hypothetical protein